MTDRTLGSTTPITFFLAASSDHRSPLTGATPAITLSKNGGAFAPAIGAVSEIDFGWYAFAPAAGDVDTVGDLVMHAAANGGADALDVLVSIIQRDRIDALVAAQGTVSTAVDDELDLVVAADLNSGLAVSTYVGMALVVEFAALDHARVARKIIFHDAPNHGFQVEAAFPAAPQIGDRVWVTTAMPLTPASIESALASATSALDGIQLGVTSLVGALVVAQGDVPVGSTETAIRGTITFGNAGALDGSFIGMTLVTTREYASWESRRIIGFTAATETDPMIFTVELPIQNPDQLIIFYVISTLAPVGGQSPWDQLCADHTTVGTFGEALGLLYGAKANFRIDNMTYDGSLLVAARLRVFADTAAAEASTSGGTGEGELWAIDFSAAAGGPGLPSTILGSLALLT